MRSLAALEASDPAWVGRYRLVGRLGAGGMGRVYLARSPGGRAVAVKVVRPELAEDPGFRERFAREVAAARRVNSFFTAGVVDADPEGTPAWLATAYVPGMSLAEAVEEHGRWPESSVSALGAALGEALDAIHGAGLVHRDLKPPNVLIAADGPRVIDFGISVAAEASALTETGMAVGTPGFMAPEQLVGDPVGPATDVFALGAVLAYAGTGAGAFGTGSAHAVNFRAVYEPPRLDGLPPGLRDLVASCLAKRPEDRPPVPALLAALAGMAGMAGMAGEGADASRVLSEPAWLPDDVVRTVLLRQEAPLPAPETEGQGPRIAEAPTAGPSTAGPRSEPADAPMPPPSPPAPPAGYGPPRPVSAPPRPTTHPRPGAAPVAPGWRRVPMLVAVGAAVLALVVTLVVILSPNGGGDPTSGENGTEASGETDGGSGGEGGNGNGGADPGEQGPVAGELFGSGATSQQAAQEFWAAEFSADNPDSTVSYTPLGSGAGREQFTTGQVDFAGTDVYLSDQDLADAGAWCPEIVELPVYLSPIGFAFQLDGVSELSLSPETLARIFDGRITTWHDPAIRGENPGVSLPDTPITPVHRSDPTATTELLTRYLAATAPADWPYEAAPDWPVSGGEGAQGQSGVLATVAAAPGTIGYADAAQIDQFDDLGVATLLVGGEPVGPTAEAVGRLLEVSERVPGRGPSDFAYDLAWENTEPDAYPLVQVSYAVACASPGPERAEVLRAYLAYIVGDEGQQEAASATGSAPLPEELSASLREAVNTIG